MATVFEYGMQPDKEKFLVTDNVPERFLEGFDDLHFEVVYYPELTNEALGEMIEQFHGIVINSYIYLTKEYIDRASRLKYILRPGSGLDNVDLAYAEEKGILVINSPEANKDAVGEHAIGMLLGLINHIPRSFEELKRWHWHRESNKGTEIKGKTIGIIGYGNTGQAMARKLSGFEAELLVYDKYKQGYGTMQVRESTMEEIQRRADIISLHVPLDVETKYLVDDEFLSKCRKSFYLINTSRGKVVRTQSVLDGIRSGKLLGAALDVLENEKLETYTPEEERLLRDLLDSGKVLITPHIAGWTREARENIFMLVLDKFADYLKYKASEE